MIFIWNNTWIHWGWVNVSALWNRTISQPRLIYDEYPGWWNGIGRNKVRNFTSKVIHFLFQGISNFFFVSFLGFSARPTMYFKESANISDRSFLDMVKNQKILAIYIHRFLLLRFVLLSIVFLLALESQIWGWSFPLTEMAPTFIPIFNYWMIYKSKTLKFQLISHSKMKWKRIFHENTFNFLI